MAGNTNIYWLHSCCAPMLSPLRKLSWQCNHRMTDCARHTIISSIFCKSVSSHWQMAVIGRWQSLADSSHWQIAVDSLRKRLFDSSRTAFGLPPSPQPRYMYYLKAMMGLEPRISSQGSTYFLALWFTIVKTHTLRYWRWCWPILWRCTPFLRLQ